MFQRRLTIDVVNASDVEAWDYGGEWFECGECFGERVTEVKASATLMFESYSWTQGLSGYVFYHSKDRSQTACFSLSCPLSSSCAFGAVIGEHREEHRELWEGMQELAAGETTLWRSGRCTFELLESDSWSARIRCALLPRPSGGSSPAPALPLPPELLARLGEAKDVEAPALRAASLHRGSSAYFVERNVVVELDNASKDAFCLDGDWFESGCWMWEPVRKLEPSAVTELRFTLTTSFCGVCGLCWFVDEATRSKYVSVACMHPISGPSTFRAWAGPPPAELYQELYLAPEVAAEGLGRGTGCEWSVAESGCMLRIKLRINADLRPIDLNAYGGQEPTQSGEVVPEAPKRVQLGPAPPPSAPAPPAASESHAAAAAPVATAGASTALALRDGGGAAACAPVASDSEEIDEFLASTRPRDALDGIYSGVTAAGAGVLAGGAALIAMPYAGAQEDGAAGFVTGLCKGTMGFVGLSLGGVVAGATQVVRGMANTPDAISQVQQGKRWDVDTGTWVLDCTNLNQEAQLAAVYQADGEDTECPSPIRSEMGSAAAKRDVADTAFYDLIGAPPEASVTDIKKAYYKTALRVHPDKNPDNPEAKQKFQELTHAYQVLSTPELRARYDASGMDGVKDEEVPTIDPKLFFGMLFGSEQFDDYVGKLQLAMQTDHLAKDLHRQAREEQAKQRKQRLSFAAAGDENAGGKSGAEEAESAEGWVTSSKRNRQIKQQQFLREVRLAVHLADKLGRWVLERRESDFEAAAVAEASKLVQAAFGSQLLQTIGAAYERGAEQYIAALRGSFTLETQYTSWSHSAHSAGQKLYTLSSIARGAYAAKTTYSEMEEATSGGAEKSEVEQTKPKSEQQQREQAAKAQQKLAQSFEDNLPTFLQAVWDLSVMDIESTLHNVCGKVLKDVCVPWQLRFRRARALLRLGQIFQEVGARESQDPSSQPAAAARRHVEEAFLTAAARGRGGAGVAGAGAEGGAGGAGAAV